MQSFLENDDKLCTEEKQLAKKSLYIYIYYTVYERYLQVIRLNI